MLRADVAQLVEQFFRKEEISGSNPLIGSKHKNKSKNLNDKMKKFFSKIWAQVKYFIVNPFWVNKINIILIILTIIANAFVWYLYLKKYHFLIGMVPISYSSAVLMLNVFLASIIYRKELAASYILLGIGMFIQVVYLVFLKFFAMGQAF